MEQLTFGERLVGITFNPSNDGDVNTIKTKMAEVANLLVSVHGTRANGEYLDRVLFESAIGELLNAQMNAVKYVTLKY